MKEKLRAEIGKLSEDASSRKAKSSKIAQKLFALPQYTIAKNILFYTSLPDEVDTREILKDGFSTKNVLLPITNTKTHNLELGEAESFVELEKGAYGILEPTRRSQLSPVDLELALVPGRAFDTKGHRLGRGEGYYDRFLPKVSCPKIALAFEYQILDEVPSGSLDISVNKIITEERIIECSP